MSTSQTLLRAEGLHKSFRLQRETVQAVNDVSLQIDARETVALVGESGSGKSTLARMVLGLVRPDAGQVWLQGQALSSLSGAALRTARRAMQPVFQDAGAAFNPRRTVEQSLAQALEQAGRPRAQWRDAAIELLHQVRLDPGAQFLHRYPHELSGGQRQRLGIARALAVQPRLIVADEPLSGADISIRGQILNLLVDLQAAQGVSYLFITHDMAVAREFAHRVLVMYRGRIVEQGAARAVFAAPSHPYTQTLVAATLAGHRIGALPQPVST